MTVSTNPGLVSLCPQWLLVDTNSVFVFKGQSWLKLAQKYVMCSHQNIIISFVL